MLEVKNSLGMGGDIPLQVSKFISVALLCPAT